MYSDQEKRKDIWNGRVAINYGKFIGWSINLIIGGVILYAVASLWIAPAVDFTMPTPDSFMLSRVLPAAGILCTILYFTDYRKKVPVVAAFTKAMDNFQSGMNANEVENFHKSETVTVKEVGTAYHPSLQAGMTYYARMRTETKLALFITKPTIHEKRKIEILKQKPEMILIDLNDYDSKFAVVDGVWIKKTSDHGYDLKFDLSIKAVHPSICGFNKTVSEPVKVASVAQPESISLSPLSASTDPFNEVVKWKKLLDEGVITPEEFDKKKKEILHI